MDLNPKVTQTNIVYHDRDIIVFLYAYFQSPCYTIYYRIPHGRIEEWHRDFFSGFRDGYMGEITENVDKMVTFEEMVFEYKGWLSKGNGSTCVSSPIRYLL